MMGWLSSAPQVPPVLPEPKTKKEFLQLCETTLSSILKLADESDVGWEEVVVSGDRNGDTRLYAKVPLQEGGNGGGTTHLLKTTGTVACSPQALFHAVSSSDIEERKQWEKDLIDFRQVQTISKDIQVIYTCYRAPSPVTSRDFVAIKAKKKLKDGRLVSFGTSITHSEYPLNPNYVRGVATSAFIISQVDGDPSRCHCIRFTQIDPKGSIPSFVINLSKQKAAAVFSILRHAIEEKRITLNNQEVEFEEEEEKVPPKPKPTVVSSVTSASPSSPIQIPQRKEKRQLHKEEVEEGEVTTAVQPVPIHHHHPQHSQRTEEEEEEEEEEDDTQFWNASSKLQIGATGGGIDAATCKSLLESIQRLEANSEAIMRQLSTLPRTTSPPTSSELSFTSLSWGSLAFLAIWPLTVYAVAEYISSRPNRRR